jgi:hypothetical protein
VSERHLPLSTLVLLIPFTAHALEISGINHSGMPFKGSLVAMDQNRLVLRDDPPEGALVGIPAGDIRQLGIHPVKLSGKALLEELEPLHPFASLLEPAGREMIREALFALADGGEWPLVHTWTGYLPLDGSWSVPGKELPVLRLQALLAMGLNRRARTEAEALAGKTDRLTAPTRLCWIMAHLLEQSGDDTMALAWARLPSIQVPAGKGPLADELAAMARRLEQRRN